MTSHMPSKSAADHLVPDQTAPGRLGAGLVEGRTAVVQGQAVTAIARRNAVKASLALRDCVYAASIEL
jgi:hypothetical protein